MTAHLPFTHAAHVVGSLDELDLDRLEQLLEAAA
jgi:hypothetical protein